MIKLLLVLPFICVAERIVTPPFPVQFFGTYDLEKTENFDFYLRSKGYRQLARTVLTTGPFQKSFKQSFEKEVFAYDYTNSRRQYEYFNIRLDTPFQGHSFDDTKTEITFTFKDGLLIETHKPLEDSGKEAVYEYSIDGEWLVIRMEAGEHVAREYWKRRPIEYQSDVRF